MHIDNVKAGMRVKIIGPDRAFIGVERTYKSTEDRKPWAYVAWIPVCMRSSIGEEIIIAGVDSYNRIKIQPIDENGFKDSFYTCLYIAAWLDPVEEAQIKVWDKITGEEIDIISKLMNIRDRECTIKWLSNLNSINISLDDFREKAYDCGMRGFTDSVRSKIVAVCEMINARQPNTAITGEQDDA